MKSFFEFISKEVPHLVRDNSNSEVKASRKLILRACFNSKNIGDIKALWKWYVSMCVENQVGHYQYDCFTRMFHDNGLQMHEYA
jgi:hypothetical protein